MERLEDTAQWLRSLPKAELHLHLDGSLRPSTALDLARTRGVVDGGIPVDAAAMRERLVAPPRGRSQAELLRAFDLPIALLQDADALERATHELVEDVASDGTRYAEIRWAPALHTERGLSLAEGIAAVARGASSGGEAHPVSVRLIAVALRTHPSDVAAAVAHAAVERLSDGVTGFDLAGIEEQAPDPSVFAEAFEIARAGGLGITCHAGEWGGAKQVWRALDVDPWRIAHGLPAADDPELIAELRARDITLDLCPTSNLQAGIGSYGADAPLPHLLRSGVPLTISTDDRTVSDLTLVTELQHAMQDLGLTPDEIVATTRRAYSAAFLHHDEALRERLQGELEGWLVEHPAPA